MSSTTTITEAYFRETFNEFANPVKYSSGKIQMYLLLAQALININRWGDYYAMGVCLFVAHNCVIDRRNMDENDFDRPSGTQVGPIGSESGGGVGVTYDVGAGIEPGAGHWNLSNYGTRFIQFARLAGAGPVQVNGPYVEPQFSGPAWPGPWQYFNEG